MYTLHIEFNISEIFLYYFLFTGLSLLSVLNLDKNRLHTLHSSSLKNCTGLQSLSLSHNFLTQVPEAVHHLSNLEILDLSSNLLGVLKRESLQGLPKLKSLKLGKYLYIYLSISIFPKFYGKQVYILYWLEELNCRFFFFLFHSQKITTSIYS